MNQSTDISASETTRAVAEIYFDSWRTRDFARLRTVLASDVGFVGVMGVADGADACLAGLQGMAESIMDDLVLHARVVDGAEVITWFDLVTTSGAVLPTANWSHVENGVITRIRVAFDPRPLGLG